MERLIVLGIVSVPIGLIFISFARRLAANLPPGPQPKLITGNLHQLPHALPWETYAKWSREIYGPVFMIRSYNRRSIFLNTAKSALDLLESRSGIYSDRPSTVFLGELLGRNLSPANISNGHPRFKRYRRLLHLGLSPSALRPWHSFMELEAKGLLRRLKDRPKDFVKLIRRNAGAIILNATYGWKVDSDDDYFVGVIESVFKHGAAVRGNFLVDSIPWLRYIPAWFPGAEFQRIAQRIREALQQSEDIPFEWTKKQIATGNYPDSFISRLLNSQDIDEESEDVIKRAASTLYSGGADTTVSALTTFLFVMAKYPDIQSRAQAEVDSVLNHARLPVVADLVHLPYIDAIVKEVLRWAPPAPLGIAHRVTLDDIYMGYRIPKGTTVYANIWAILHDPECYPNPEEFDPTRFLGDGNRQPDPRKFAFGFGKRICPGAHFAETSLRLNIVSILSVFDISKPKGVIGNLKVEWSTGITTHPTFACEITPRSRDAFALLEN